MEELTQENENKDNKNSNNSNLSNNQLNVCPSPNISEHIDFLLDDSNYDDEEINANGDNGDNGDNIEELLGEINDADC